MQSTCSTPKCGFPAIHGGLCDAHDAWEAMHQVPRTGYMTPVARFYTQVERDRETGCDDWLGGLDRYGYGKMTFRLNDRRRYWPAHVFAVVVAYGPFAIPDGYEVDHTCRNTRCVRLEHLEVVTKAENQRRASSVECPQCGGILKHGKSCAYRKVAA